MIRSSIRSLISRITHSFDSPDDTVFNVLEYNGCLFGWTITASRRGFDSANLLKERCELTRPNKLFRCQPAWQYAIDDGELVDERDFKGDRRELFSPWLNRSVLQGTYRPVS